MLLRSQSDFTIAYENSGNNESATHMIYNYEILIQVVYSFENKVINQIS